MHYYGLNNQRVKRTVGQNHSVQKYVRICACDTMIQYFLSLKYNVRTTLMVTSSNVVQKALAMLWKYR